LIQLIEIGLILDPNEQAILMDWYNSMNDTSDLNWDFQSDLCGQTGITCQNMGSYKSVTILYSLFSLFFFL